MLGGEKILMCQLLYNFITILYKQSERNIHKELQMLSLDEELAVYVQV